MSSTSTWMHLHFSYDLCNFWCSETLCNVGLLYFTSFGSKMSRQFCVCSRCLMWCIIVIGDWIQGDSTYIARTDIYMSYRPECNQYYKCIKQVRLQKKKKSSIRMNLPWSWSPVPQAMFPTDPGHPAPHRCLIRRPFRWCRPTCRYECPLSRP